MFKIIIIKLYDLCHYHIWARLVMLVKWFLHSSIEKKSVKSYVRIHSKLKFIEFQENEKSLSYRFFLCWYFSVIIATMEFKNSSI